jgi:hypothetical protein
VEIHAFDPAAGRPVDVYGSDFVVAQLAALDGPARIACFHLGPGGTLGRHPAATEQLFCVVAGEGWVSGGDDVPVPIGVGQAAHWAADELHAAGTDHGLVAVVIEGASLRTTAPPQEAPPA